MFRQINNNNNKNNNNKPYCRACHNAGLPLDDYTSHWTRSSPGSGGVIICPLILASECGYCHNTGHWTKFCPMLAAERKEQEDLQQQEEKVVPEMKKAKVLVAISGMQLKNYFSTLNGSDSEEEEGEASDDDDVEEIVPAPAAVVKMSKIIGWKKALGISEEGGGGGGRGGGVKGEKASVVAKSGSGGGQALKTWASIVAKPVIKKIEPAPAVVAAAVAPVERVALADATPDEVVKTINTYLQKYKKYTSWADAETSDEEDDDVLPTGAFA